MEPDLTTEELLDDFTTLFIAGKDLYLYKQGDSKVFQFPDINYLDI